MTYVIADVHGERDRWLDMLKLIQFSDDDVMYVLGDVIDSNSDGIEILLDIMQRPNIHMILANHEKMMLDAFWSQDYHEARRLWKNNGGGNTYRTMQYKLTSQERVRILHFIKNLPDHLEITVNGQGFHLVHGYVGENTHDRIWGRPEPPPMEPPIPGKTVICGHTATYYLHLYEPGYDEDSPFEIFYAPGLIGIDCGCGNETNLRRLACLRLEDMAEFYV